MTGEQSDMGFEPERQTESIRPKRKPAYTKRFTKVKLRGLKVEQFDIDNATREDSHSCMIADAIRRQVSNAARVVVDITQIRYTDTVKNVRYVFLTPDICQHGLTAFDMGAAVAPFEFDLMSTQVTPTVRKVARLDADGNVLRGVGGYRLYKQTTKRDAEGKALKTADGADMVERQPRWTTSGEPEVAQVGRVLYTHTSDRGPKVVVGGRTPSETHIVGGKLPPTHRASRIRKFGMRGFTWLDGEDPEEIILRQQKAYGWSDEKVAPTLARVRAEKAAKAAQDEAAAVKSAAEYDPYSPRRTGQDEASS